MMTYLLFAGDMLVMAFMIGLVAWVALGTSDSELEKTARLPLEEEDRG